MYLFESKSLNTGYVLLYSIESWAVWSEILSMLYQRYRISIFKIYSNDATEIGKLSRGADMIKMKQK